MAAAADALVLASASPARAALLTAAGLVFDVEPAGIDEPAIKEDCRRQRRPAIECALMLAEAKAKTVSARRRESLVIGADQILSADGAWFDKPADVDAARAQLRALRGRAHELATAVCVVRAGERLWQAASRPLLVMRDFSEEFLAAYLAAEGAAVLDSVGAYRVEGRGVQLFSRIQGDHFAILGLPLIELLGFLRAAGALKV